MELHFTKMHGIGNDYIYFDCMKDELPDPADIARKMSPRHFSVGADGIVMICRSSVAAAKMRMFNADGSEGKMCGNAIRCVAKYLFDHGIVRDRELDIETLSGIKHLTLDVLDGRVNSVSVEMGRAEFDGRRIPIDFDGTAKLHPITVNGKEELVTCVSMGNPHAVVFCDDPASLDLEWIGPHFECHPFFPERVNTEFVRVVDPSTIEMRVWERGSGETFACGTGACASVAAAVLCGYVKPCVPVKVRLIGGELTIVCGSDYSITMTGPAAKVYEGVYEYEN